MTRLLRKRGGFYCDLEELSLHLLEDIRAYKRNDPAARSAIEVVLLYNGLHATIDYRIAHWFYRHRCFFIARAISQWSKMWTGIEIHPGAQIGRRLVIDHGAGIVIGETTQIGDDCLLYQGVTLGGTGKDVGKRHPTLGNNVMVGSGAKVLGPFRVGDNARIAANAVVLREVPEGATVVGVFLVQHCAGVLINEDSRRAGHVKVGDCGWGDAFSGRSKPAQDGQHRQYKAEQESYDTFFHGSTPPAEIALSKAMRRRLELVLHFRGFSIIIGKLFYM